MAELGLIRVLFLGGMLAFILLYIFQFSAEASNAYAVAGLFLALLGWRHIRRKDKLFLKSRFEQFRLMMGAEYILLALPVLAAMAWYGYPVIVLLVIFGSLALAYLDLRFPERLELSGLQRLVPVMSYEWKAGMRRYGIMFTLMLASGLAFAFWVGSVPAAIFIGGMAVVGFYEENESLEMLISSEAGAGRFLGRKVRNQVFLFSAFALPLIIAFIAWHPELWYVVLIEFILITTLHIYIVFVKYTFYRPSIRLPGSQVFSAIGIAGLLIPVFMPLLWILSAYFYVRAVRNLKVYLYDFD